MKPFSLDKPTTGIVSFFTLILLMFLPLIGFGQSITTGSASATACPSFPTAAATITNIVLDESVTTNITCTPTLVITAPAGFQFVNAGTVTDNDGDVASVTSVLTNSTTITYTFTCEGGNTTNEDDIITLTGIQIIGIGPAAGSGNVTVSSETNFAGFNAGAVFATLTSSIGTPPTTSTNGGNQTLAACATSTTLTGNTPTNGTGTWTVSPAGPTFSPNANTPGATANGMVPGTTYTYTWTITNSPCGSSASSMTVTAPTGPGCIVYCSPASTADCHGTYGVIQNVTFDAINNTTASQTAYENFTGQTTNVLIGDVVNVSVTAWAVVAGGGCGVLQPTCLTVFIDWNGDGDFSDTGETTTLGPLAVTTGAQTFNSNITVPAGAFTGGNLLMRVVLNSVSCANPCVPSGQGQVEDYTIIVDPCTMTTPNAGPDQNLAACATGATLAGNVITDGTGSWSLAGGTGTITTPSSPTSTVTNLGPGANTFVWTGTPTNPGCPMFSDQVTITTSGLPTAPNAGTDSETCMASATLAANTITTGTGLWSCSANCGGISFSDATSPTSTVNGLVVGVPVTLTWTATNGACVSTDDVIITRIAGVTAANAGADQPSICTGETVTLAGNNPASGIGTWTGTGGIISDPNSPTSGVNALNTAGSYTFTWTVSAPGCASSTDNMVVTVTFCDPDVTTVTCPGPITFTDGGGNYTNDGHIVQKYCPSTPGQYISATFTTMTMYNLLDHMIVLNGANYSAPIIDDFYSLGTIANGPTITSSSADGCLTFIFESNASGVAAGWSATITCTATPSTTNVATCGWNDCLGGCLRTICSLDDAVTFNGDGVGANELNNVMGGCLATGERCSNWFLINPESAGTLSMDMFVNAGQDQDFALWEAYEPNLECPAMTGDDPILCNFAGATAAGTGFNSLLEPTYASYESSLTISQAELDAGIYFIILVNTYNNGGACPQPTVDIDFGGDVMLSCDAPIALGLEIINFNGVPENRRNFIYWETANDENIAHFTLERSKNGQEWEYVGTVNSAQSSDGHYYSMYDEHPYSPFTYYRVKQMNMEGEIEITTVISVSQGDLDNNWVSNLLPNPTSNEFSFQYQGSNFNEPLKVVILNSLGMVVYTEEHEVKNKAAITINTTQLANGTYQVMMVQGDNKMNKKLSIIK